MMPSGLRKYSRALALALVGAVLHPASALALPQPTPPPAPHPAPEPAALIQARSAELRVQAILRRILIANRVICAQLQYDHGLVLGEPALFPGGAPIVAVQPGSAAEAVGLQPGDLVRRVNSTPWSPDLAESTAFARALGQAGEVRELTLVIERNHTKLELVLQGQTACRGEARLAATRVVNATAIGNTIIIEGGLERLLPDDAELAFAVAHEAAHVILGHTAPANRAAIGEKSRRQAMEREADALALRLMARAGYDPVSAARAWPKIADASRAPLLRLMDIHGPYMGTAERSIFLESEAMRIARGGASPLRAPARSR